MHVLLLGASPETNSWEEGPNISYDTLICADGGLLLAEKWHLKPDWVLGDGDSYGGDFPENLKKITYPSRKDETDFELALYKALELGAVKITLVGFLGGRLDHTLTNLSYIASLKEVKCSFLESWGEAFFANEINEIYGKKGDLISLIPFKGDVKGVSTEGLEYPLLNETLFLDKTRGISNVFIGNKCSIKKTEGTLLIVHFGGM